MKVCEFYSYTDKMSNNRYGCKTKEYPPGSSQEDIDNGVVEPLLQYDDIAPESTDLLEIDEATYDAGLAAQNAAMDAIIVSEESAKSTARASATTKLDALGFTAEEIKVIL